jgi:hypothetical protein
METKEEIPKFLMHSVVPPRRVCGVLSVCGCWGAFVSVWACVECSGVCVSGFVCVCVCVGLCVCVCVCGLIPPSPG